MDRKTVLALIIIGIIFVGWMYLTKPQPRPQQSEAPVEIDTSGVREAVGEEAQSYEDQEDTTVSETIEPVAGDSLYARFEAMQVDTIRVETDRYIALFSSRGANLVSFRFKKYHYNNGDTTMVEMVPPWAKGALKFQFPDAGGDGFDFNRIVFSPDRSNIRISGGNKDKLTFTADLGNNSSAVVEYEFYGDRYDFSVRLDFQGASAFDLGRYYYYGWEPGLESTELNRKDDFNSFKAYVLWDTGLEGYSKFNNGQMSQQIEGNLQWLATTSKYFFVGVIPDRAAEGARIQGRQIDVNVGAGQMGMKKIGIQAQMEIHQRKSDLFDKYMVYIGPIDYSILKSYNRGFEETVSLGGILKPISLFILWLMRNLYKVFHNYGIVIIIFSILMKVVFYPLTSRSLKSMKKMQELQPRLKALQEKYKKEPQKMQGEIMKLWKENKVNPMSGCLLMLPQLPIFFALFTVFRNTILLRGSEFVFWMKDLSQPDSTMILPIIMAGTMFLQQKMTMQDPKQKMLVYVLPIVFFFLFKGFPTGLVLYWTMFNVLSVLETLLIRKPQQQKELAIKSE